MLAHLSDQVNHAINLMLGAANQLSVALVPKGRCRITRGMLANSPGQVNDTINLVLKAANELAVVLVPK
jgi:hypothetical protein